MTSCRVCGHEDLRVVVDLGTQTLSGVFPHTREIHVEAGPLKVAKCRGCGLAQLSETYSADSLYGQNYGYRSGLNRSMVEHLRGLVASVERNVDLAAGDIVVDIGANDGTLLRSYTVERLKKIAVDPTIAKYCEFYSGSDDTALIPELFTAERLRVEIKTKAKVVTSIAMFYDLENPIAFARDVASILADDGIWMLEQSYAPWMVKSGAFDTICHEHLEYYSFTDIARILDSAGLAAIDVTTNQVNGGSFNVIATKKRANVKHSPIVNWLLKREQSSDVNGLTSWLNFASRIENQTEEFLNLLRTLQSSNKTVAGLGASTKGNVILQSCGISEDLLPMIGEVNPDKFGSFTPGSLIPIVPEAEVLASKPDFIVVFPWHFRDGFVRNLSRYLVEGGRLIFPLPDLEIVAY